MAVRAALVGERLHLRGLAEPAQGLGPLVVPAGKSGLAMLFRYGAVVMFELDNDEQRDFLKNLRERIEHPLRRGETEDTLILLAGKQSEGATLEGVRLEDYSIARLQILATVLARSVTLAYYESTVAAAFDQIEPLARELELRRGGGKKLRELLRHIGGALLVQQRMTGRVEIQDKPDVLWDHPALERLFLNLGNEYELAERNTVLERKLALIARTAETAADLIQSRSMLRVEWYIVLLIVVEVLLYGYDLLARLLSA
ncbi:MAG: hypothetical protein AMJ84_03405 [Acidithiobacillales bacterium SM23_46]|nr:MAG: hypothetical protein AMJ84_03405 [Acidithiobacillales bacterium SM23_46]